MSEMTITFVGTGNAFNHEHGNNSAVLKFNGTNLLLDCGHTVPAYLEQVGLSGKIQNIWISHLHGDHIGGLEEIGFSNYFVFNGKKSNLFVPQEIADDLKTYLEVTMKYSENGLKNIKHFFNFYPVKESFTVNKETFFIEKTQHIAGMPSYMLRGSNFIYTGDTRFIDWSQRDLTDIKYIFQDTQLQKYSDNDVHTSLPQLVTLPLEIKKKIHCMHYGNDKKLLASISKNGMKVVNSFKTLKIK